jgi:hypothetical protein
MSSTFVLKKQVTLGIVFVGEDCTGFPKIWAVVQLNHFFLLGGRVFISTFGRQLARSFTDFGLNWISILWVDLYEFCVIKQDGVPRL